MPISAEEHDVQNFQSTLTALCSFLPWWLLSMPFSVLSFQLSVIWVYPLLINCYKECIAFISPTLQMDGGKKNMHDSFVIVGHVWNSLCTDFLFP